MIDVRFKLLYNISYVDNYVKEHMSYKMYKGHKVMSGSKAYDLLESSDPKDHKKATRLLEFCDKAAACFYQNPKYSELREQYKDAI